MPYSSRGRPATALSATLGRTWPSYSHELVPSPLVMNCGARSAYLAGSRSSNSPGGSTTWSSTLTSTISLISMAHTPSRPPGVVRAILPDPPPGVTSCLLYTSDAADDLLCVDLG